MIFAAYPLGLLIDAKNKILRVSGVILIGGLLALSVYWNILGIIYTYDDPRTHAGKYIAEVIPPGASIAFLKTGNYYQFWLYPFVDGNKYKVVSILDNPDYVLVAGEDKMNMRLILGSGKLLPGYQWDRQLPNPCPWTAGPPHSRCIKFYVEVLPSQYFLLKSFERCSDLRIEFRSGRDVFIYKRK